LIWEKGDVNQPNWLHIGWKKQKTKEILVFNGKGYVDYFTTKYIQRIIAICF
jgi:hypothetical protein